ncbi:MAG: hypothetical protein QOD12_3183 [Verrucomicrobiota bacterium]
MNFIDHWVVGFSGKRLLENPDPVRAELRRVLRDLQELAHGQLVAISSAAIGSDLLFIEEVMQLGIPWICVLPFPAEAFFNEHDFPDAKIREAARLKLTKAADVEVIRAPHDMSDLKNSAWRRAAFAEAGLECVDAADLVIAVLHEPDASAKPGGTSEVVAHARATRRPLIVIDPLMQSSPTELPSQLRDPVTEQLRHLPAGILTPEDFAILPTTTAGTVAAWRSGFARAARRHVPGIRWASSAVVILHALATIITAIVFLVLHPIGHDPGAAHVSLTVTLERTAFVFVLSGFGFLVWILWKQPQSHAANYRLAAEIGRSILASWNIPCSAGKIVRGLPREFAHFARNLLLHRRLDPELHLRREGGVLSSEEIEKLALNYVRHRITPQINYYSERYVRSKRAARALEIGSIIFSLVAVVSAGFLAFGSGPEFQRAWWGLAKLLAATAAPVTVSMLVIHEVKRREARYHEMLRVLQQYAETLRRARSISALQNLVTDAERMLLSETYEWWVLAKSNAAA